MFLVVVLVFIVFFRDFIADGASDVMGSFGTGDVDVQRADEAGQDEASQDEAGQDEVDQAGERDPQPDGS